MEKQCVIRRLTKENLQAIYDSLELTLKSHDAFSLSRKRYEKALDKITERLLREKQKGIEI